MINVKRIIWVLATNIADPHILTFYDIHRERFESSNIPFALIHDLTKIIQQTIRAEIGVSG